MLKFNLDPDVSDENMSGWPEYAEFVGSELQVHPDSLPGFGVPVVAYHDGLYYVIRGAEFLPETETEKVECSVVDWKVFEAWLNPEGSTVITSRNELPCELFRRFENGDRPALADVVDAWTTAEFPCASHSPARWTSLFRNCGYHNADAERIDRPESVRLFRGGDLREGTEIDYGMSWTTSREQAQWFAGRRGGVVFEREIPGHLLLADYTTGGRKENEFVVAPSK